jgi:adenylate cyclase
MAQFLKFIQKPIIVKLMGGLLVFLLIVGLRNSGHLEFLELAAYDWFMRMEPKLSSGDPRITLIEISEKDIHAHGRWPLTDEALAKAMNILVKDNPRAIGLDIYRDILVPPGSEELNAIFVENPQIIGVMTFGEKGVRPPAIISNTEQVGFNDILVDPGGIVRRALIFLDDGENVYNSFALRLASLYLHAEGIALQADPENPQYIRLKDTTIKPFDANDGGYIKADARGYQFLLDFENAGLPFRSYSFSKLLSGEVPAEAIADKIILIGVSAQSVKDFFYTPLSKGFEEVQQVPGVVLHGHIISQLLRFALDGTSQLKTLPETQKLIWILLWSLTGGLIGLRIRSVWRFSILILGGLVLLCLASYFAFLARWWIPLVPPALSFFISAVVVTAYMSSHEKKERALLMQLFSRHVSKEIAEIIWQQKDQFLNDGRPRSQKMTATVFFSDLKGFTTMSEKMDPQELIDWLNAYMEPMTRLIMEHGGVIDDYAGDGIKANFGVPLPRKNEDEVRSDAMNAINCALAMEKEMCRLNAFWSHKGLPAMGTRVGIFTGTVVAGLLGSSKRLKYTTVGDTVNIAARLESYDKEVGKDALCRILIGEPTLRHVNGQFKTERIGEVSLKGKDERIIVHRVLGDESPGSQAISKEGIL